ncbi:diguanylate cyclase/phosphodiesterase with PAS/PAC sensor [Ahrensia sp. R2A130]|nr:diguanylate cyclase/phosphodiesterase with PAS/PAC sensor [Ahrensia sp. R2A130]
MAAFNGIVANPERQTVRTMSTSDPVLSESLVGDLSANVRTAYVAALIVVALLAGTSYILLDRLIVTQGKTATIINTAGGQRMLSQRITGLGQSLARKMQGNAAISDQLLLRHEITGAIGQLESSHIALVYGDKVTELPGITNNREHALYFSEPHRVDSRIKEFSEVAYALLEAETVEDAKVQAERLGDLGYGDMLNSLNTVVDFLEVDARKYALNVQHIHLALLLMTMLILLGEAAFIFRPMEKKLQRSVDRIRKSKAALQHASRHDALTELGNRQFLRDVVKMLEATKDPKSQAIVSIDLDRFKAVNDTYGHAKGDELLIGFAKRAHDVLRTGDRAFRLGGDEFVLLLAVDECERDALKVCARVANSLEELCRTDPAFNRVTASFGVTLWPAGQSFHEALVEADIALYESKGSGRNRVTMFEDWMKEAVNERNNTEAMIELALAENRFEPHFQPQIDMRTGRMIGLEVLARLRAQDGETVLTPNHFLEVAERTGQIIPLGMQIIEKAVHHAATWRVQGAVLSSLSVNASAAQILDEGFLPSLKELLEVTGYPVELLTIEVLECVMLDGTDTGIVQAVKDLRDLGVRIELDDFGMGHTSIANVTSLGVHRIKIDRSFIAGAMDDDGMRHVLKAMIAMAQAMNIGVLAEGIETELQQKLLLGMGCVYGQGYHFARPMAADALDDWLGKHDDPKALVHVKMDEAPVKAIRAKRAS